MREAGCARAARKNELLQGWQTSVERVERRFEALAVSFGHDGMAGHAQLAAQVEEVVLHPGQALLRGGRKILAQEHSDEAVELVDDTHRFDPWRGFRQARAVGKPRRAVVAGARIDLSEPLAHRPRKRKVNAPCWQ